MSKNLTATVDIAASPEQVWDVLVDVGAYSQWNPFIVEAEGTARPGSQLVLRMQPVGSRAMTLKPTVREVTPGQSLQWVGRLFVPGLMDAAHTFTIESLGTGCRLVQRESFRGLLVPFVARSLDTHTLPAFVAMNAALKARVEQVVASRGE